MYYYHLVDCIPNYYSKLLHDKTKKMDRLQDELNSIKQRAIIDNNSEYSGLTEQLDTLHMLYKTQIEDIHTEYTSKIDLLNQRITQLKSLYENTQDTAFKTMNKAYTLSLDNVVHPWYEKEKAYQEKIVTLEREKVALHNEYRQEKIKTKQVIEQKDLEIKTLRSSYDTQYQKMTCEMEEMKNIYQSEQNTIHQENNLLKQQLSRLKNRATQNEKIYKQREEELISEIQTYKGRIADATSKTNIIANEYEHYKQDIENKYAHAIKTYNETLARKEDMINTLSKDNEYRAIQIDILFKQKKQLKNHAKKCLDETRVHKNTIHDLEQNIIKLKKKIR